MVRQLNRGSRWELFSLDPTLLVHHPDTGIGIPVEVQAFMFEPFRQADSAPTRRYRGSGLGLYIVKHFLERMGGVVTAESEVGRGSTFRVWLPARIGER